MKQELWRKAEKLFHASLERSPEARREFLDEACGEDTELRRQVEMLISKDEQAGSLLERPVLADALNTLGAAGSLVGRQFGSYRILEVSVDTVKRDFRMARAWLLAELSGKQDSAGS